MSDDKCETLGCKARSSENVRAHSGRWMALCARCAAMWRIRLGPQ